MDVLVGFVAVVFIWAVVEFFFMLFSYDDYGENWFWSSITTIVIVVFLAVIIDVEVETTVDQEAMLEEQWSEDDEPDAKVTINISDDEREEIKELFDEVEQVNNQVEETQQRVVPANRAYIDASRRRNETVSYDHDTREACSETTGCFRAQLIQHTDGSFWACRRNYGACYEY